MSDSVNIRQVSSMDHWFPILDDHAVPVPQTEKFTFRDWDEATEIQEGFPINEIDFGVLRTLARKVGGPPAFIRTDQSSAKHTMAEASRLDDLSSDSLRDTVAELLQRNEMAGFGGLPYRSIYVREWLDLNSAFTAFQGTPIASEVRVFVNDGDIWDSGFYWPHDAIEDGYHRQDLPDDWESTLDNLREHALSQVEADVYPLAERVAAEFPGYWSVDFAETEAGDWYCIDMAKGEASWHPDSVTKPNEGSV